MSVINTNITSMIGQSNLQKSQNALQTSMERLSSGLRINSAKDDAAGQAIANRMTAQITGLAQAQRNANDGISVAQTAEGALNQVNDNLQRIRELAVQAANGTNSSNDLQSIQDEINQRLAEIDRISSETNFNGVDVLAQNRGLTIQVGANDGETITVNLQAINAKELGLDTFKVTDTLTMQPNVQLGDAIANFEVESFDSITGEISATGFDRTITLENANVTDPSAANGILQGFLEADDGNIYALYDDSGTLQAFEVTAADIDSNGNIDLTSATAAGTLPEISSTTVVASDASDNFDATFSITPTDTGSTITLPAGEAVDSVVEDGDGNYYVKSDAGNFYAIDQGSIANDGTFTLDATTTQSVALQDDVAGNAVTGELREILDSEGNGTGTFVVEQNDGTLLAVDNIDRTTGEVTIQSVQYTDANGATQTLRAQAGGVDGLTAYVELNGQAYNPADIDGLDLQANPNALEDIDPLEELRTDSPLAALDAALNKVDSLRSELGAVQNRFEDAITNLSTNETNLAAARSRIEDADYAVEVANMTRAQILQQAGTSVLAQANQIPQNVLSLLG